MKKLILLLALCLLTQWSMAQTPKWVEKAKRAVFSVVTYDKDDNIKNTGNGFFISEDGVALSDYKLFKEATRAVIISSEGKQMPVGSILGANEIYDVVKFRVDITEKKVPTLVVATTIPAVGSNVWMLPYSTQKSIDCSSGKVRGFSKFEGDYHYYTLDMPMREKLISCPVMNAEGQVFGIAQKSSGKDTLNTCYAVGATFAMTQKIAPLSLGDATLRSIGIKKAIPEDEEQALIYLLMASSQSSAEAYAALLDEFIAKFPNSADGYIRRAMNYIATAVENETTNLDKVVENWEKALKVAKKKDDVYFNIARVIYNYQLTKPEKTYKDWTYDNALIQLKNAQSINPLPVYTQLEGDIHFARQDYAKALACYEKVNQSEMKSSATFFNAAKTKELMKADSIEVLALMDSCVAHFSKPVAPDEAPYLLERAQLYMNAGKAREAILDYDAYFNAVRGQVNDLFYYYREQAALKARQYQRALDDIAKAIELNPEDMVYRAENAVINLRVGRYDEAVAILNEMIKMNPKNGEAYRLLGVCQIQQKKNSEACASFAKAKELGDQNVDELIKKHCAQ